MDAKSLIETLRARGLTLRVDGDHIQVEAPQEPDRETKALVDEMHEHKAEILEVLTRETLPEVVASSILAEHTTVEATQILAFWKRNFGMDLDWVREQSARVGVREHLERIREYQRRFRG